MLDNVVIARRVKDAYMDRNPFSFRQLVPTLLLLSACGGGGAGTPPPVGSNQAAITSANAHSSVLLGTAFLEGVLQLGISALDNVFDLSDAGQLSASMACRRVLTTGSGTMELTDNDANSIVSSGDRVRMTYTACYQDSLNAAPTGQVDVDIVTLSINADGSTTGEVKITIPTAMNFDGGNGNSSEVGGSFSMAFTATGEIENLTFSMSGTDSFFVTVRTPSTSTTEVGRNFSLSRRVDSASNFAISGSINIESELLGGDINCGTTVDLTGMLGSFPGSGVFRCTGRNNSAAQIVAISPSQVRAEADPEGDGSFVDIGIVANGNGVWGDYVEGTIFLTLLDRPSSASSGGTPTIMSDSVSLSVTDVAYDSVNNLLYVTNDIGITVVDASAMSVADSLVMSDRPDAVAVSDDGSTLWVGFRDAAQIVAVDAATLTEGTRVPLGVTVEHGFDRFAGELGVVPGSTDTVVVSIVGGAELLVFDNGVLLPSIFADFFAPTIFEFQNATTLVGADAETSGRPVSLIDIDANGLTLTKRFFGFGGGAHMSLEGDRIWTNSGRVMNPESETIIGSVDFDQTNISSFRHSVATDAGAGRVYFYQTFDNLLDFYDTNTLTALGSYRVNTSGNLRAMIMSPARQLFLVLDTEIHRVDTSSLGQNMRNVCTTVDLGGQFGPAVFVQIDCVFNDSVYDEARDLIYATVPSAAGPNGNSVAVIDPATGNIQKYIFVGSEPTDLSMSGPGNRLYVVLSEANLFAEVDLQNQTLVTRHKVNPEALFNRPQMPVAVAASPGNDTDVLIGSTEREIALYSSGIQATNIVERVSLLQEVFFDSTASRGYAFTESRDIWSFDVASTGNTNSLETRNVNLFGDVTMKNDVLYGRGGNLVDPDTALVIKRCPVSVHTGVEPDPQSSNIFYFLFAFDSEITVCNQDTLTIGAPFAVPKFGAGALYKTMTKAGPNRLAITGNTKMILLDPAEF